MRKWEKAIYLAGVTIATALFVVATWPDLRIEVVHDTSDEVVVDDADLPVFQISDYDSIFRVYADTIGWDWKMLAAVAYVESKFDTSAVSSVGAQGLMQIMPQTARAMGIPEGMEHNPEESVRAAVEYFEYLSHLFRRVPEGERINFVLASYNAGFGHVHDAMRLAHKYGKNRYVWNDNVETYLRLKNDSIYFTDSLCRNGRFSAVETILFVRRVQHKYGEFRLLEEEFMHQQLACTEHQGGDIDA